MDELIELIVRSLVSLITGARQPPTNRPPPTNHPQGGSSMQPSDTPMQFRLPTARQQRVRNVSRIPGKPVQRKRAPLFATPPAPPAVPKAAPAPPSRPPAAPSAPASSNITATAIRQLLRSRPATLRTIIALNEIMQPPLALRPPMRNMDV